MAGTYFEIPGCPPRGRSERDGCGKNHRESEEGREKGGEGEHDVAVLKRMG